MNRLAVRAAGGINKRMAMRVHASSALGLLSSKEQLQNFTEQYNETVRVVPSKKELPQINFYPGLSHDGAMPNTRVQRAVEAAIADGASRAFHVTDLEAVRGQARYWFRTFGGVLPRYAVKSNNSPHILRTLVEEGFGFDCASAQEVSDVLSVGGKAEDIVFSNTCKTEFDLLAAKAAGVPLMTFDSISELEKIHRLHPEVDLMIRIYASSEGCFLKLSGKAGAPEADWPELLETCKSLGLRLRGAMFHIGSGPTDDNSGAYARALGDAERVFDMARGYGYRLDTVDLGGGYNQNFGAETAAVVEDWRGHFPGHTRWFGEPGRLICSPAQTVAARVIGRKPGSLTIDDGVHGSFSCILQEADHPLTAAAPLVEGNPSLSPCAPMRIYGPTCDGLDVVAQAMPVPLDVAVGDWMIFNGMGAYTQVTASRGFNGIYKSVEIVCDEQFENGFPPGQSP